MKLQIDNKGVAVKIDATGSLVLTADKVNLTCTGPVTVRRSRKGYEVKLLVEELEMLDPTVNIG